MKLALFLLAYPLFGQLSVSCPVPGTVATLTWSDPAHPSVILRVEDNPDGKTEAHSYAVSKATLHLVQSDIVATGGTVTLSTAPGPKLAYAISPNGQPYFQSSPAVVFQCIAGPPSPPTPGPALGCLQVQINGVVAACVTAINIIQCPPSGALSSADAAECFADWVPLKKPEVLNVLVDGTLLIRVSKP